MKRVLKFIVLKVLEVVIVGLVPFGVGKFVYIFPEYIKFMDFWETPTLFIQTWLVGLITMFFGFASLVGIAAVGYGVFWLVRKNWEWAK